MTRNLKQIQVFYKYHHDKLLKEGRIPYSYPLKFNNNKTRAGVCRYSPKPSIELSKVYINSPLVKGSDIENTILHELAHAITGPFVAEPHGSEWKAAALSIGCNAERCAPMFNVDSLYMVSCGEGCMVRRHRKPTKFVNRVYRCKKHSKPLVVYKKDSKDKKYHKFSTI
jgi:predicted SprT family Zn-dependent metalloprotease